MSEVKNEIINRLTKLNGTTEVDETSEEIKQISKRFNNGTETIDDILNHCRHYMLKLENGRILDLVEKKYLDTVLNLIEKLKEENKVFKRALDKETADRSNDLLELQKKDKIIDLMANFIGQDMMCIRPEIECNKMTHDCQKCIKQYFERKATNNG